MDASTAMYNDKRVSDMTREELIEAVLNLGELYTDALEQHRKNLEALGSLERGA